MQIRDWLCAEEDRMKIVQRQWHIVHDGGRLTVQLLLKLKVTVMIVVVPLPGSLIVMECYAYLCCFYLTHMK